MPHAFGIYVRPLTLRAMGFFNPEHPGRVPVIIHARFDLGITPALPTFFIVNVKFAGSANAPAISFQIFRSILDFQSRPDSFFNKFIHILKAILRLFFVLHPTPQVFEKMVIPVKQSALASAFNQATILSKITTESSHIEAFQATNPL